MGDVQDIATHQFRESDRLFLDANIWIFLYCPNDPSDRCVREYSSAFHLMRKAKCSFYLDALILSEFINRMARLEHRRRLYSDRMIGDFKDFRNSPAFAEVAEGIAADARRIVAQCELCESGFADLDIDKVLNEFSARSRDFNDLVVGSLCAAKGLLLVTHDKDFANSGVSILTANRSLLES